MSTGKIQRPIAVLLTLVLAAFVSSCGSETDTGTGVRKVSVETAADILFESPPADLVVLDVRTVEEFTASRLPESVMIDFYRPDFEARVAELDRDVPYLLYCRSGNRSDSARKIMDDLGFTNVADVQGGITAWLDAGQPFVTG